MRLIGTYSNAGLQATADAALAFYERRSDLHTSGLTKGVMTGKHTRSQGVDRHFFGVG